ncbi:hypothetical protein [Actibacterium pelagium]|uniref:Uncharacterized protein n=1 Tax=Actibacterium pelagium TaxID=2029103 RepID=A0A917EGJ4_9RHOB|nr:hypothetical protein [Actibacterium pelagium]GGE37173.1 hypothetical protein GCM10011517_01120 [Actibacterium pelagium]
MKRIVLAIATFAATPVFAHTDGGFHAHATDYTALAIGLSLISLAAVGAAIAAKVRK